MIEVFEVNKYFESIASRFQSLAISLLIFFFIISIGIYALRQFENVNLEQKILYFVMSAFFIVAWPFLVVSLKQFVDIFDTLLIRDVFHMNWQHGLGASISTQFSQGFNFGTNILDYPLKLLNLILLVGLIAAKKIIYLLFLVFFFFYSAMGPIVISRGVFSEEIDLFLELVKEFLVLLLWQTTYVILIGLIHKTAGSNIMLFGTDQNVFTQMAQIIAVIVLILFTPAITKKFAASIGSSLFPRGFKWGGAAIGLAGTRIIGRRSLSLFGLARAKPARLEGMTLFERGKETAKKLEEYSHRWKHEARSEKAHKAESHVRNQSVHKLRAVTEQLSRSPKEEVEQAEGRERKPFSQSASREEQIEEPKRIEHIQHEVKHVPAIEERDYETPSHLDESLRKKAKKLRREEEYQATQAKPSELSNIFSAFKTRIGRSKEQDAEDEIRESILEIRGAESSDKYLDLMKHGINHADYYSSSIPILKKYRQDIRKFNQKYGWLYNYRGDFTGERLPNNTNTKDGDQK